MWIHCIYIRKHHRRLNGRHTCGPHGAAVSNNAEMTTLIRDLQKVLDLVDMGNIKWFLGMKITCDHDAWTITLSQTVYINTIAHRFNLKTHTLSTPHSTPA